jgi:MFS family permease
MPSAAPSPAAVPSAPPGPLVARSLEAARREGFYSAIAGGVTEPFMIPYALALGASSFQAGLLSSARNLLLSVVQLSSAEAVTRAGSRRAVVRWTVGLQAFLWLPIAFVVPLFGSWAVAALILLYTLGTGSAALGAPAWGSLMAEYLAPGERGAYFGQRARLVGLAGTAASLAAGGVLQLASGHALVGFALLTLAAACARALAWRWLGRFHEEPWQERPGLRFSFAQFVRAAPRSNFARFSLCLAFYNWATHLSAPYFAVYMLQELHFSYLAYTAVVLAGSITGSLASRGWGRIGDRAGNHFVVRWTLVGVAFLPLLWAFTTRPGGMAAWNVLGAFLWGGVNLASSNFLYDAVTPPKRHTCLAYFNVLNGLGISVGAFTGGVIVAKMPTFGHGAFTTVFVLSTALRLLAAVLFVSLVREVRSVREVGVRDVFFDLMGQRMVQVIGFFNVRPEQELPPRRRRRRRRRRGGDA